MAKQVRLLTDVERDVLLFLRRRGDEGASVADIVKEGVTPFTGIAGDALKALKRDKLVQVRNDLTWRSGCRSQAETVSRRCCRGKCRLADRGDAATRRSGDPAPKTNALTCKWYA
jgi:hypothetical protein